MAEIASLAIGKYLIIKSNFMLQINFTDSISGSNSKSIEVQKVLQQIKKGSWKDQISKIQSHISNGNNSKANDIKRGLPAFTISATFKQRGRTKVDVDTYTNLLHLDYDYIDNVQELKAKVVDIPYTYAAFISPSGKGLKVLVKSDGSLSTHEYAFNTLKKYYDGIVGITSDSGVKDLQDSALYPTILLYI